MKSKILSKIPLALSGYALGLGGLGGAIINFISEFNNSSNSSILLTIETVIYTLLTLYSFIILIIVMSRFIYCFNLLKSELKTPNKSGFIATAFMCICQLGGYIGWMFTNYIPNDFEAKFYLFIVPNVIVLVSLMLHFIFLYYFFKYIFIPHNYSNDEIFASWFVPLIGIVICVTCFNNLGNLIPVLFYQTLWFIGLFLYFWVWPVVIYKFLFLPHSSENDKPSMGIFTAPANLLSVGFLDAFNPNNKFKSVLNNEMLFRALGSFMIFFVATSIVIMLAVLVYSYKKQGFSILWTSFTFPTAVAATSLFKFAHNFFIGEGSIIATHYLFFSLATILLIISLTIITCLNVPHWKTIIQAVKISK